MEIVAVVDSVEIVMVEYQRYFVPIISTVYGDPISRSNAEPSLTSSKQAMQTFIPNVDPQFTA
jgi:hypothetical protein